MVTAPVIGQLVKNFIFQLQNMELMGDFFQHFLRKPSDMFAFQLLFIEEMYMK